MQTDSRHYTCLRMHLENDRSILRGESSSYTSSNDRKMEECNDMYDTLNTSKKQCCLLFWTKVYEYELHEGLLYPCAL